MSGDRQPSSGIGRRDFLKHASLGATVVSAGGLVAGKGVAAETKLPTVALGEHQVTRLIAGYNPVGGYSHCTAYLSRHMREWFTVERTVQFLQHCEELGINTFQFDLTDKTKQVLDALYEKGSKLQFICLHSGRPHEVPFEDILVFKPIAIVHHGGVTDALIRGGKEQQLKDYLKQVHDHGVMAGISAHSPANIARIAEEDWENDLFMTCFYYVTRTRDDMLEEFGAVTVGEPFFESDPDAMTAVVRQVKKPCLGFKILAAGRKCGSKGSVGGAFKYAFANIKPQDAVIVGMFPQDQDEVQENVEHTLAHGAV